jgi:hypothetical protein
MRHKEFLKSIEALSEIVWTVENKPPLHTIQHFRPNLIHLECATVNVSKRADKVESLSPKA